MSQASGQNDNELQGLARRYGVGIAAVKALLSALADGGGSMAQFSHPELGGNGQWMRGGMTMIGDMGNQRLKQTVSDLAAELSSLLEREPGLRDQAGPSTGRSGEGPRRSQWWPAELGNPSTSGSQNDTLYAYFPDAARLALSHHGDVTVYDTQDHRVSGVQQQQGGGGASLSFTSQRGTFTVDTLPLVRSAGS
jgi:hypothetical protein